MITLLPCPFCGCVVVEWSNVMYHPREKDCILSARNFDFDSWNKRVQGSEVHAPQGPAATPIPKSPSSGPTDNDSKEEEWDWKAGENALLTAGKDFFDIERKDAEEIARLHNTTLSALRARLQKQEEDRKRLDWIEDQPFSGMDLLQSLMLQKGHSVRSAIDAALSQTPALVHSETEELVNWERDVAGGAG